MSITRRVGVASLVMAWLVSGCSAGPPVSSAVASSPTGPLATPPAPSSISSPAAPTAADATDRPAEPTATPDAPIAVLVAGDERVTGKTGGHTFGLTTSSAPWLPATALEPVRLQPGSVLRVELDGRATVATWIARLAAAADTTGDEVTALGQGSGPIVEFGGPAAGDWVVEVTVTYGGGLGNGAYYWRLVVEE